MTPGFLFRKSATPAAGTHQRISATRLSATCMSDTNFSPRNLVVGGDVYLGGSNKYDDWNPATNYTWAAGVANAVEHGGKQWALLQNQAPTGTFPGYPYWMELRPLLWFRTLWGDVRKTAATTNTRTIVQAAQAAGAPLRLHQYIYLTGANATGETYNLPTDTWLNTNHGWLLTDGEVTAGDGSNRVAMGALMASAAYRFVSYAKLDRRKDSNGWNWARWYAETLKTDSNYSAWKFYGFAVDDMICTRAYSGAEGDYITGPFSATVGDYFGTGHHRLGVSEDSEDPAAQAAIAAGMVQAADSLRKGYPGVRVWFNGGQSKPWDEWAGKINTIMIEGPGSWYSIESQRGTDGWQQLLRDSRAICLQARGRAAPGQYSWRQYDDYVAPDTAARPITQPIHQDMRFGLCTALLTDFLFSYDRAGSDYPTYADKFHTDIGRRFYIAEYDAELGVPVGAIPDPDGDGSGFWSREYTNGLVVVRPKGASNATWGSAGAASFTLPFDCVELTGTLDPEDQGRTILAGATISLLPRDARILLRA